MASLIEKALSESLIIIEFPNSEFEIKLLCGKEISL